MESVLIRGLDGRTFCVDADLGIGFEDLRLSIERIKGIPAGLQRLTCEGRELRDGAVIAADSIVHLNLRLLGGKGGFGSLMRAYAAKLAARAKNKDQDIGAMRDLNGRRMRHVQAEKKIAEWRAQEHKVDHVKMQKTFKEIAQGKRPTAEKGKCKFGVNCKYKWKCKFTHPDDEERAKAREPVSSISEGFGKREDYNLTEGSARENVVSAVQAGLKNAKKRARPGEENGDAVDIDSADEDTSSTAKKQKTGSEPAEKKKPEQKSDTKAEEEQKKKVEVAKKEEKPKNYKKVNLKKYKSAAQLEKLGLEHLKAELTRVGLKCGGNLTQRAERLFLLKDNTYDQLPKKVKAKKK